MPPETGLKRSADQNLLRRFMELRALSGQLAATLSDGDATAQSMPDTSPAKWHLAHVTWFFETFVLRGLPGYQPFDPAYHFLFNSYYEAEGERHPRPRRGMLTRPSLDEVLDYRSYVDAFMAERFADLDEAALGLVELGLHHEQQHQELLLTDILHLFAQNPLQPAYGMAERTLDLVPPPLEWIEGRQGIARIGHEGQGFAFDCEGPAHEVLLHPHALADRTVTNAEWRAFIEDGGYSRPELWLSDGWAWVKSEAVAAPLYWQRGADGRWSRFGLDGPGPIEPAAAVTHISYYEADAYARWADARLPTEAEWESAAQGLDPDDGNFLDAPGAVRPHTPPGAAAAKRPGVPGQMFGNVWEWTGSAYLPYPGFRPCAGAVGEYNGKFMSGQFVLKGGSCASPRGHLRASYRNFFYPHQRWQFTGVRLAKDL